MGGTVSLRRFALWLAPLAVYEEFGPARPWRGAEIVSLRSETESASLRAALEPRYRVENIQRSFRGIDSAVVELRRTTRESVAANVWRRPHSRVATTWRESLIAAARRHGTELTKNQARTLIEQTKLTASVTDHNLIDLPLATLARLRQAIDETARPYSTDPTNRGRPHIMR